MASISSNSASRGTPHLWVSGYCLACFNILGGVVGLSIFVGTVFFLLLRLRRGFYCGFWSLLAAGLGSCHECCGCGGARVRVGDTVGNCLVVFLCIGV